MTTWTQSEHLIAAAASLGTSFTVLDAGETAALRQRVENRFADAGIAASALWERLRSGRAASTQDPDGWRRIDEFTKGTPFVVFFERPNDGMLAFVAGVRLVPLLEEAPGFVFYVTDAAAEYLVCFNDHNFLIVA